MRKADPKVGIFWVLDGTLIIDGVYLNDAEPYGRFVNFPRGHDELWSRYQLMNVVPRDLDYDQAPRGRVVYEKGADQFLLYADLCILRNEILLNRIKRKLRLPSNTLTFSDAHYQCKKCSRCDE